MNRHWWKTLLSRARHAPPVRLVKRFIRWADDQYVRLDRRAHPGRPPSVLFDVHNPIGLDAQAPVIRHLLARGYVQVAVAAGSSPPGDLAEWLSLRGIDPGHMVSASAARHRRYQVTVITDAPGIAGWRRTQVAYLHHGSSSGNLPVPYAFKYLTEGTAHYLFCLCAAEVEHCAALCGESFRSRLAVTGAPKLDALAAERYDRAGFLGSLGLDASRKTVLLSSHWRHDALFRACRLEVLRDYFAAAEANLLVTAHYHLFNPKSERFSGGIDWLDRLRTLFNGPRMRVLPRVIDNRMLLAASDVLVGDQSSIHLEFAVLFRPMILYQHPAHSFSDATLYALVQNSAAFVGSVEEMPSRIDHALGSGSIDLDARRRLLDYCFAYLGEAGLRTAMAVESLAIRGRLPEDQPAA